MYEFEILCLQVLMMHDTIDNALVIACISIKGVVVNLSHIITNTLVMQRFMQSL